MNRTAIVWNLAWVSLAGLVLAGPEAAAQDVREQVTALSSSGSTLRITRPGSYRLSRDLRLREDGAAVVIAASGVSLDLDGHALTGPGAKTGTGILIDGGQNVSVRNGTLQGFGFGVRVVNAVNVKLQGLQVAGEDLGGPGPGEVGVLIFNSRGVEVFRNVITRVFLGVFVRGEGSGGNRIAENVVSAGAAGQIGVCYNPDGLGTAAGPRGDTIYNNLLSGFNIGIQTSAESRGNIFRENDLVFVQQAVQELSPSGANAFADNTEISRN